MILDTENFVVDSVTECLTENCKDCTGSYINKILGIRIICNHTCHKIEIKKLASCFEPKRQIDVTEAIISGDHELWL